MMGVDKPGKQKSRKWTRRKFLMAGGLATVGVCTPIRFCGYDTLEWGPLAHLSNSQAAILAMTIDTLLPDVADRTPEMLADHVSFVDGYMTGLPSSDRAQFGYLLYLIEHVPIMFSLNIRRFSRLPRESRIRYMQTWQRSGLGHRRLGYRSLKSIAFIAHYRTKASFELIGYTGPVAPGFPGPEPSQIRYAALVAPESATIGFGSPPTGSTEP